MPDPDFLLVLYCNIPSILHRFQVISICLQSGNDVITISPLGGASGHFSIQILKAPPRFPISVLLSLLFYLSPFKSYNANNIWLGFPIPGTKFEGFWGQ